jgi:hypothetical protein
VPPTTRTIIMLSHTDARLAADEAASDAAIANCHAVLFSLDLWVELLWPCLDIGSKRALRIVSRAMRDQVDGAVTRVASAASGAADLASTLARWHGVVDLTLRNVSSGADLAPLSTASLAGLTRLVVRQVGHAWARMAHAAPPVTRHTARVVACQSFNCLKTSLGKKQDHFMKGMPPRPLRAHADPIR